MNKFISLLLLTALSSVTSIALALNTNDPNLNTKDGANLPYVDMQLGESEKPAPLQQLASSEVKVCDCDKFQGGINAVTVPNSAGSTVVPSAAGGTDGGKQGP